MTDSPFNTPMTVAQLEARCKRDNVDIHWEVPRPASTTVVTVDDEKHGIWNGEQFLGKCIVWGG